MLQHNYNLSQKIQYQPALSGQSHSCDYPSELHSENFLLQRYQQQIIKENLTPDSAQEQIIFKLQTIFNALVRAPQNTKSTNYISRFLSFIKSEEKQQSETPIKGLYIAGGVGRGKTYVMDLFYESLPIKQKLRLHFHRFMQLVHDELSELAHVTNPLQHVAEKFAKENRLICLDEMHVNDITDAMILGELFQHLFANNVVLVTTSNSLPAELYKDGLQRDRFLPAIALLEKHTEVLWLDGKVDYRLQKLKESDVFIKSAGQLSEQRLKQKFNELAGIQRHADRKDIIINHRRIAVKQWADGIAWFDFDELCKTPRSTQDYIEIARYFHNVMISDIPVMDAMQDDIARRFINMIDAFYDHHVKLIFSAEAKPEALYTGKKLAFEFRRTQSRLIEMQSVDYMASKHVA